MPKIPRLGPNTPPPKLGPATPAPVRQHKINKDLSELKTELITILNAKSPLAPTETTNLVRAFDFMARFHAGETLPNGEKTITHILDIAKILQEWGAQPNTIAASLLAHAPGPELGSGEYGPTLLALVRVRHLLERFLFSELAADIQLATQAPGQLVKKALLLTDTFPEIWLLIAAEMFHSLSFLQVDKDTVIKLNAACAFHLLPVGLRYLGREIVAARVEDIAFLRLDPTEYERVEKMITDANKRPRLEALEHLRKLTDMIDLRLTANGLDYRVEVSIKEVAQTYKKLATTSLIKDISRFRYIIDGPPDLCKTVFELIEQTLQEQGYHLTFHDFKNYIPGIHFNFGHNLGPKPNGYQSIHAFFVGKDAVSLEVQVRTQKMDEHARRGPSAHGRYKTQDLLEGKLPSWKVDR